MRNIFRIPNRAARRIFLHRHALLEAPSGSGKGKDLEAVINRLGFVQVDSINTVCRAHHMILHSRRQSYRQDFLAPVIERDRAAFEHWTHDASIIPTRFFPHWRLRFARNREKLGRKWRNWQGVEFERKLDEILQHVSDHGPVTSGEVGRDEKKSSGGWWDWHPSKTALEYLWQTGRLSVTRREGFRKVYDLTERVIPGDFLDLRPDPDETIDWACNAALDRLGFATSGELAAFWALVSPAEAKAWCAKAVREGRIVEVQVEGASGHAPRSAFARPDLTDEMDSLSEPSNRVRVLSPFDPALRDRKRAERLFGFHYRIEVFVPEPKRQYGYYVFPVLEGDTLIGRIDMKCQRTEGCTRVTAFWPERGTKTGRGRIGRLEAELNRMLRLSGSEKVVFSDGWLREPV